MPVHHGVKYTLRKRGDSWTFDFRFEGKRERGTAPTEEAILIACEATIDRLTGGQTARPTRASEFSAPTLQRVYELVRNSQWKGTRGEATAVKNAEDCIAVLGATTPINRITTAAIDEMIGGFKDREMEPGTIRRKLAALSSIIKYAATRHYITALPMIDRKAAGKERKRLRFLSTEEEQAALKFLSEYATEEPGLGKVMADFFTLLIDTGLRLSEGVKLKWSEVDGDKAIRLSFDNKGEQPRMVPLTERLAEIIKERRKARQADEKLVWPEVTSDRATYFWQLARKALKYEDDKDFVIHACRHTFASRLAQQGVGLTVIKELGGWKTLEMVLRYSHLIPQQKEDAIRRMQGKVSVA
jgi:integrase